MCIDFTGKVASETLLCPSGGRCGDYRWSQAQLLLEIGKGSSFFHGSLIYCLLVFFVGLAFGSLQHQQSCFVLGCLYPLDELFSPFFEYFA